MATLSHAESRRLYSWWWDSHISPKNSKWLQENLTDMDVKVKSMIKLIEEDADSFRKRAEMYYRKRPELMKLVEEFYRAYRALAERYDHATGALRQAHRTMAEAFPDQIPLILMDDSPPGASIDAEPPPQGMLPHDRALDHNGLQKDSVDATMSQGGLWKSTTGEEFANGWGRNGLDHSNAGGKGSGVNLQQEVQQLSEECQKFKNQIKHETERADKAEAEVGNLKDILSKLELEKEAVSIRYQLSLEKISSLEADISGTKEDFKKLNDDVLAEKNASKILESRCHLVEKENQFLQSEVGLLKETMEKQQEELYMKKEELEKLNASRKEEHMRSMQAEMARSSLEKLLSQSQEEVRCLSLEIQNWAAKLTNMETSKVGLEEEIKRLNEELGRSNEQICTYSLKIKNLQDEVGLIEKSKRKLEDEAVQHVEEKKHLQQEVLSIKTDKKALEQRHHELTEQIGAVNVNVGSLQAMVKDLRDGNVELKDLCKKHDDERTLQLESLRFMEKITEKNAALESSLSTANSELDELREKAKTLEKACEALQGKISMHISEKAVLVSQIEAVARSMEKLLEKNRLLENSLSDVNVELEGLRGDLDALEKSCQTLRDQNSTLLAAKSSLLTEVESIGSSLDNLERRYAELEGKNTNLEAEKDQMLHQVRELQHSLRMQKEEYETLNQSSRNQLDDLECQIRTLQEKGRHREEELELEHHKIIDAQLEILILLRVLHDMRESNMLLSDKCQKYLKMSSCQEEHISELQQEILVQQERIVCLTQFNEKVVKGVRQVIGALKVSNECDSSDDIQFGPILLEIEGMKTCILDAQDDILHHDLERSVILSLLEQCGLDLAELRSEKNIMERELTVKLEEISVLQSGKHQLLDLNEQLRQNVQASHQREQALKAEVEILCKSLADVQDAHSTAQRLMSKLIEESQSFLKKINDLTEKNDELEENNNALIAETLNLEHLCLIFRSYNTERVLELQLLSEKLDLLHGVNSSLEREISLLKEKLGAVEIENMDMKESLDILKGCKKRLVILEYEVETLNSTYQEIDLQFETNKNLLSERDQELRQVIYEFQVLEEKNAKLSGKIEGLLMDIVVSEAAKEEAEKKTLILVECNTHKDNKIADLHHLNNALNQQIDRLTEEVEELNKKEKNLTFELMERIQEVESCEAEIETLLDDIHTTTVMTATFEEKMFELLMTCESLEISSMLQKEMFYEETSRRNVYEGQLKEKLEEMDGENSGLKEELNAYLPLILSLGDCVISLEQRIFPLANHRPLSKQEKEDGSQALPQEKSNKEENENQYVLSSFGIMELQKLRTKVNALEEVVLDILGHLENGGYGAEIESEDLKSKRTPDGDEAPMGRDIILHLKKKEDMGDLKTGNAETSEQMMKDIQLDHVISSSHYQSGASSHMPSAIGRDEDRDRMMELWETIDRNKMEKPSPVSSERDLGCHQIEALEEEESVSPASKQASEKELSIDKLELMKKVESYQEYSGSITESLSSDAQRLSVLQKNTQDLKRNMDASELSVTPTSFEFKQVRAQLKEAEAVISQLIDANGKLARKAEKLSSSSGSLQSDQIDKIGNTSARKISERAMRGSEKIGRLELELQKLEYIWLKLKEEHDYKKARAAERRTRVLLRDYLYGRRESPRRKKVHCCACIRPRTKDE